MKHAMSCLNKATKTEVVNGRRSRQVSCLVTSDNNSISVGEVAMSDEEIFQSKHRRC